MYCCLPSGFYLISPSEFERFSLSTRHVVEPRSLVEVPLHSGSSTQHRPQPDGASSTLRYVHSELLYFTLETHNSFQYSFVFSVLLEMPDKTARTQVKRQRPPKCLKSILTYMCMCHWLREHYMLRRSVLFVVKLCACAVCLFLHTNTPRLWPTVLTCPLPAACVFQKVQLDVLWSMLC